MLVYGDVEHFETIGTRQNAIKSLLSEASRLPPGIERHTALATAFICASELVQGLVDAEFQERGFDARSAIHDAGMEYLSSLARSLEQSWRSGFAQGQPPSSFFENLLNLDLARTIRVKRAEGHAFYALYPESYLEAARDSRLGSRTRVIGIRSIGTGLSSLVAAALDAPPPFTIRPVGHPYHREIRVDPAVTEEFTADKEMTFAIVDEGPGLSGSSFGAAADWLEAAGVSRERIHFFPSHNGQLGPQASQSHRERWISAPRHVVTMERLLLHAPSPRNLRAWIEDLAGPLSQPLEDISGGAWRMKRYASETQWPAANVQHERRKFLAQVEGSTWLVKFIGLGKTGMEKFKRAGQLHEAGFTPEVAGFRHGFLVERWHEDSRSLDQAAVDREWLVEQVGSYLGFRARHFVAGDDQGASLDELSHMTLYNVEQALGKTAAAMLEPSLPSHHPLQGKLRRVATDNRMHAWEWLVLGQRLIKTDALDHCVTHDLVGSQDITWDIAGAVVELGFSDIEARRLCRIVQGKSGHPVFPELLAFMRPCYLAFHLGAHTMAAEALGEGSEATRLRQAAGRYACLLGEIQKAAGKPHHVMEEQEEAPAS
jgi:hypothetical protein